MGNIKSCFKNENKYEQLRDKTKLKLIKTYEIYNYFNSNKPKEEINIFIYGDVNVGKTKFINYSLFDINNYIYKPTIGIELYIHYAIKKNSLYKLKFYDNSLYKFNLQNNNINNININNNYSIIDNKYLQDSNIIILIFNQNNYNSFASLSNILFNIKKSFENNIYQNFLNNIKICLIEIAENQEYNNINKGEIDLFCKYNNSKHYKITDIKQSTNVLEEILYDYFYN